MTPSPCCWTDFNPDTGHLTIVGILYTYVPLHRFCALYIEKFKTFLEIKKFPNTLFRYKSNDYMMICNVSKFEMKTLKFFGNLQTPL